MAQRGYPTNRRPSRGPERQRRGRFPSTSASSSSDSTILSVNSGAEFFSSPSVIFLSSSSSSSSSSPSQSPLPLPLPPPTPTSSSSPADSSSTELLSMSQGSTEFYSAVSPDSTNNSPLLYRLTSTSASSSSSTSLCSPALTSSPPLSVSVSISIPTKGENPTTKTPAIQATSTPKTTPALQATSTPKATSTPQAALTPKPSKSAGTEQKQSPTETNPTSALSESDIFEQFDQIIKRHESFIKEMKSTIGLLPDVKTKRLKSDEK